MQKQITRWVASVILGVTLSMNAGSVIAAVEVHTGNGGACLPFISELQRSWMEVKRHLVPIGEELQRASDEDFVCVDPRYLRDSREIRLTMTSDVRCFKGMFSRGFSFCCDPQLLFCATLNPALFPETYQQRNREAPEPQKSDWVEPPSESQQWKSNE